MISVCLLLVGEGITLCSQALCKCKSLLTLLMLHVFLTVLLEIATSFNLCRVLEGQVYSDSDRVEYNKNITGKYLWLLECISGVCVCLAVCYLGWLLEQWDSSDV